MLRKNIPVLAKLFIAFLISLVAVASLFSSGWGRELNLLCYDFLFERRGELVQPSEIVIVAIDEPSFSVLNLRWPWPRSMHAKAIDRLFSLGAKSVAVDLMFSEPSLDSEEDKSLADVIAKHQNVVLASELNESEDYSAGGDESYAIVSVVQPKPILDLTKGTGHTGFVNFNVDTDGYLRRAILTRDEERSLAAKAYELFSGESLDEDSFLSSSVNFQGPPRTIKTISYYQLLDEEQAIPKSEIEGKLVFIGYSLSTEATVEDTAVDHFLVPFSRWSGERMAGVEVHANAAHNLIHNSFIFEFSEKEVALYSLALGTLFTFLFLSIVPTYGLIIALAVAGVHALIVEHYFFSESVYLFPAYPLGVLLLGYMISPFLHYLYARKDRAFIKNAFSTYMSPKLVKELLENPELLKLGGEERDATVMFLDIAGFTAFSEKLSPGELIDVVNRCLGCFAEVIIENGGMIDKYIGDCIMALWGVPLDNPKHAEQACDALFELQERLPAIVAAELERTGVEINIRIGLNSGRVVAGNVGGGQQFNYTVLGNEVNLAARLEAANKTLGTRNMLSEETVRLAGEKYVFREVDKLLVVGKKIPIKVYELLGQSASLSEKQRDLKNVFEQGLDSYKCQEWNLAISKFKESRQFEHSEKSPSKFLIARCEEFLSHPPPSDWDGVFQMTTK